MALVDAEQDYQYSGAVSDASMVEIGYKLGAQYLIYGAFDQLGGMLQLTVQATDVETAEVVYYQSYTISSSSTINQLLGDKMELSTLQDFLEAIARCERKINGLNASKNGALDNYGEVLMQKYAKEIQEIYEIKKEPWESNAEYDDKLKSKINVIMKRRDAEIASVSDVYSPKYDTQIKSVQAQKDKIINDLKNTTFVLNGKSVLTYIGDFDAESTPKNWPVSIKSADKLIAYSYDGKYVANSANVKTEYQIVEAARSKNDLAGEIRYKVVQGGFKDNFDIFIDSVRLNVASTGVVLVNEGVRKVCGTIDATKVVEASNNKITVAVVNPNEVKKPAETKTTTATNTNKNTLDTKSYTYTPDSGSENYRTITSDLQKDFGTNVYVEVGKDYRSNPVENVKGTNPRPYVTSVLGKGAIVAKKGDADRLIVTFRFGTPINTMDCEKIRYEIAGFAGTMFDYECHIIYSGSGAQRSYSTYSSNITKDMFSFVCKNLQTSELGTKNFNKYRKIEAIQFVTRKDLLCIRNLNILKEENKNAAANSTIENIFEDQSIFGKSSHNGANDPTVVVKTVSIPDYGTNKALIFSGNTGKPGADGYGWLNLGIYHTQRVKKFMAKGNTLNFSVLGDGNTYYVEFEMDQKEETGKLKPCYKYTFKTKKGKVTEVSIPYSRATWEEWTTKGKMDGNNMNAVRLGIDLSPNGYYLTNKDYSATFFDFKVVQK